MTVYNLLKPNDLHVHVRQDGRLRDVLKYTAQQCAHALVMPNLKPPIRSAADALRYKEEILTLARGKGYNTFRPLMTLYLTGTTTPEMIKEAARAGVTAVKFYPLGGTTNSEAGIADILHPSLTGVLHAIQQNKMKLCLHGEVTDPDADVMDLEMLFLETLKDLASDMPDLEIVLEHITSADAVAAIEELSHTRGKIAATITAHHLKITQNDVLRGRIQPDNHCLPIAKKRRDRDALWAAITSENPVFFLGSDTAPHPQGDKWCAKGCAGIFTAPVLMQLLATMFEARFPEDWTTRLENFATRFGAAFYNLHVNEGDRISLKAQQFQIPMSYDGITPFMAGETLPWTLVD